MPSMWKRAMVYLGLADDEEYGDYADYEEAEQRGPAPGPAAPYTSPASAYPGPGGGPITPEPGAVRMLPTDEHGLAVPEQPPPYQPMTSAVRTLPRQPVTARLHVAAPSEFASGAKEVGDKLKGGAPVIMNLSGTETTVARRLLDYASGVTYALSGKIKRVGRSVFLLTPQGVDVSAEDERRLRETGILADDDGR